MSQDCLISPVFQSLYYFMTLGWTSFVAYHLQCFSPIKRRPLMPNKAPGSKRTLAKKVTSFNMYLDQATQIQAIMEATGADKDAPVLRTLLDEALANRRRR